MSMIEKVAAAIDGVDFFWRFNDWTNDRVEGFPNEICKYGDTMADEIIVVERHPGNKLEGTFFLSEYVSKARARAAIEAMREPTPEMLQAGYGQHYRLETKLGMNKAVFDYDDMIRAALKEPTQ